MVTITSIKPPEAGWPVLFHCSLCKMTVIALHPWALKPSDGDYWKIEACADEHEHFRHNMVPFPEPPVVDWSSTW